MASSKRAVLVFERAALVHYHEIGLKGRNRSRFEDRLRINLKAAVRGLVAAGDVERLSGRIIVRILGDDAVSREEVLAACAAIPGVSHVSDAVMSSREDRDTLRAAEIVMREVGGSGTFRVDARRSNTDHPVSSLQMNVDIGAHLVSVLGRKVDLTHPDVTCRVEVVQGFAFVYARRLPGPGGLPVGTSGKVVALLSSGIDSPVAAWRVMKRGAVVIGVHFSGYPATSDDSTRTVMEIAGVLDRALGMARVYSVPFGDLQRRISLACPPDLRVLLYRRLMVRIAESIATTERAGALVTGESLGQVASQTLENVAAVDDAATLPMLRPLIGMDKNEITADARRIGTYELSIRQDPDCCTLFMPRNPQTHATVAEVIAGEEGLDLTSMVSEAVASARYRDFACPSYRKPREPVGTPWEPVGTPWEPAGPPDPAGTLREGPAGKPKEQPGASCEEPA
jgi:thiamine biosynthesis protein ThiI